MWPRFSWRRRLAEAERNLNAPRRRRPDRRVEPNGADHSDRTSAAIDQPVHIHRVEHRHRFLYRPDFDFLTGKSNLTEIAREGRGVPAVVRHPAVEVLAFGI